MQENTDSDILAGIRRSTTYHAASILLERMPDVRGRTVRIGVGSVAMLLQWTLEAMARGRPMLTAAAETDADDFETATLVALADLGYELRDKPQETDSRMRHIATNIKEETLWRRLRDARRDLQ